MALRTLIVSIMLIISMPSWGWIPDELDPVIVESKLSIRDMGRVVDLSAAFDKAAKEQKPMFVYLDADDCPMCRKYNRFVRTNLARFKQLFKPYVVVDIRTSMNWIPQIFRVDDKNHTFDEFKLLVGDNNRFLTYPYYWLLGPDRKQLRQLPIGAFSNSEIEKHAELLTVQ